MAIDFSPLRQQQGMQTDWRSVNEGISSMAGALPTAEEAFTRTNRNYFSNMTKQLLGGQFNRGLGLMGNMTQMQQGMDENLANAYVNRIAQQNQIAQQKYQNQMGSIGIGMNMSGNLMEMFG